MRQSRACVLDFIGGGNYACVGCVTVETIVILSPLPSFVI